jgi:hypothetical protein
MLERPRTDFRMPSIACRSCLQVMPAKMPLIECGSPPVSCSITAIVASYGHR